jgi:hypothetical protein
VVEAPGSRRTRTVTALSPFSSPRLMGRRLPASSSAPVGRWGVTIVTFMSFTPGRVGPVGSPMM